MRKDKEWLKEQVGELEIVDAVFESDNGIRYIDTAVPVMGVRDLIDQLDEPEKVVIPQFVADWIKKAKTLGYSISVSMGHTTFYGDTTQDDKAMYWAKTNQDTFARAWLDGYEVEKEPLYYVVSPDNFTMLYKNNGGEAKPSRGHSLSRVTQIDFELTSSYRLTEKEIKDFDPRYWPFAEPEEESQ